jgi:hypothetical protein
VILARLKSTAASSAENLLKFILQTTCTQQLRELKENVKQVLKSSMNVKSAVSLTLFTGVAVAGILTGMHSSPPMTWITGCRVFLAKAYNNWSG